MKHRAWLLAAALLAVLIAAHTALWWYAEQRLAAGVADWRAALAAQGWHVRSGEPGFGGWPFAATRVYPNMSIEGGPVRLHAARLAVSVAPSHAGTVWLTAPDGLQVALPNVPVLRVSLQQGQVAAPLRGAPFLALDAAATQVASGERVLGAGRTHIRIDPRAAGVALSVSAQSIALPALPEGEDYALGPRLASLSGDAELQGAVDPARLDAGALASWRDAGGGLTVARLALGYGPLGLSAQGRFGLDGDLQPAGTAQLRIVGYQQTIQALVAGHALTAAAGRAVGALLTLLATTPQDGGVPEVDTTLHLEHRTLSVAGYDLLRLRPVSWPAAQD
jgi:hypothetical protein